MKMRTRLIPAIFFLIISMPLFCSLISLTFHVPADIVLRENRILPAPPEVSVSSVLSGQLRDEFTAWFDQRFRPRGVITKAYATLNYDLFSLGAWNIGKNKDLFEDQYIYAETCFPEEMYDYARPDNEQRMAVFVSALSDLNDNLRNLDKFLYVYITPSKAAFHRMNIPDKYLALEPEHGIKAVDSFRTLMEQSGVPFLICSDLKETLEYPAFYTTGIHWSRTYEQIVSHLLIDELSDITGYHYRNFDIGTAIPNNMPYWRDADVYDLLNVWEKANETYYQFDVTPRPYDSHDKMRFLVYADSFGIGLQKDILDLFPEEEIYLTNYNIQIVDSDNNVTRLPDGWDSMDFAYYLDRTDVVIIQIDEVFLRNEAEGFVYYLNNYLEDESATG